MGSTESNVVLIHCDSGKNRSVTFTMAYLVKRASEDPNKNWLKDHLSSMKEECRPTEADLASDTPLSELQKSEDLSLLIDFAGNNAVDTTQFFELGHVQQAFLLVRAKRKEAIPDSSPYLQCVIDIGQECSDKRKSKIRLLTRLNVS